MWDTLLSVDCRIVKGNVREKWKGIGLFEKYLMVIAINLTSICCVYKEKLFKNDSYQEPSVYKISESCNIRLGPLKKSNLIPNKAFRYYNLLSLIFFRRIPIKLIFHNNVFMIWEILWKHSFLFQGFLIMKTTYSHFPGTFDNPAQSLKTSCKLVLRNINFFKSKILWNIN